MMYNEAMRKILFLLMLCLFITSCASTSVSSEVEEEELQIPPLFSDWQYRGFGTEYPLWAEQALKEGNSQTIEIRFGQNLDVLIPHEYENEYEETESNVFKEIWVYIDPYYEEYEERYAYITLRRAQGPQGQEE